MKPTTEANTATFRCATASVTLTTDIAGALNEARKILYSYDEHPGSDGSWQVHLNHDPDIVTHPNARTDGDEFDIGPQTCAYRSHRAHNVFWVPARRTLVHADPTARVIWAWCDDVPAALDWAPRLVRQAMTAQLLADGMVYAHAAAFTYAEHGVLIAGNRGRGKTTTLLASLHHLGGNYCTNDRLMLHATGEHLHGYPWPMPLRAGIGTLTALPHLRHLVAPPQQTLPVEQRWTFPTKIVVEPPAFPALMQPEAAVARALSVSMMLWPDLDPARTTVQIERVDPDDVTDTLSNTGMFMHDPQRGTSAHTNHWLAAAPDDDTVHRNMAQTAAVLAKRPCFRIRAGADPVALAAAVGRLLNNEVAE
ncbi:hypothetical protein [Salinispora arenicola]|uniref:hypothetical protein n=1 Tax=Salinispora arenicola TaxID=168697 RepID=UPI0003731F2D|nr:hypothetical protein [Salinispora arenicola]